MEMRKVCERGRRAYGELAYGGLPRRMVDEPAAVCGVSVAVNGHGGLSKHDRRESWRGICHGECGAAVCGGRWRDDWPR